MELKRCPSCGKQILAIAKVCKYCGHAFERLQEVKDEKGIKQTGDDHSDVIELAKKGQKLEAVKLLKERTGWSMKKSIEWVDDHCKANNIKPTGCLSVVLLLITTGVFVAAISHVIFSL
jgi:ribosomal protein L32